MAVPKLFSSIYTHPNPPPVGATGGSDIDFSDPHPPQAASR